MRALFSINPQIQLKGLTKHNKDTSLPITGKLKGFHSDLSEAGTNFYSLLFR